MQIITITYEFVSFRMAMVKIIILTVEDARNGNSHVRLGTYKFVQPPWRTIFDKQHVEKIPAVLLPDVYPRETQIYP